VWRPKIMQGGLVAGHDFSPQWPGVVRAVWENRPRQSVFLAMDWMYWWTEQEDVETRKQTIAKALAENQASGLTAYPAIA